MAGDEADKAEVEAEGEATAEPAASGLNTTAAVTEWTRRKMAACMLNAAETDVTDFKKPGGAFLTWDRVATLSKHNESMPEHLSDQGYEDLDKVMLGKDSVSLVGG